MAPTRSRFWRPWARCERRRSLSRFERTDALADAQAVADPKSVVSPRIGQDDLLDRLHQQLRRMTDHRAFAIADNLNVPASRFRYCTTRARRGAIQAEQSDRTYADFVAAFGSDVCYSNEDPDPIIQDTAHANDERSGSSAFPQVLP